MGLGKPILVSNVGSFKELSDNTLIKIDVDENEEISILKEFQALTKLDYRTKLGNNAKKHIENEHDPKKIAYEFYDFISYIQNNGKMQSLESAISEMVSLESSNFPYDRLHSLAKKLHSTLK